MSSALSCRSLRTSGVDDNTIVVFTTDNGAENFTWPDGGQTPFAGGKGTVAGRRLPRTGDHALAGQGAAGTIENGDHVRPRLVPDLRRGRGQSQHREELKAGKQLGDRPTRSISTATTRSTSSPAKARRSATRVFYFAETTLGAVRIGDYKYRFIDQPQGWLGNTVKVDWPILTNLKLDPFERTGMTGSMEFANWYMFEFWRFVFVQQDVAKFGQTFIDFPPMQTPACFNLEAVKEQIMKAISAHGK